MAVSHFRSVSLPSTSHPLTVSLEEQLSKLVASQSSSSIYNKLSGLKDLYECVDDFLQLPNTKQILSHEQKRACIDEALDGSLRLLDTCSTARDVLSQLRESVQDLESSLRRRKAGGESALACEVDAYVASRKRLNKIICKCLKNLKKEKKNQTAASLDNLGMLKGVEEISTLVFESILSFVSQPKLKSNPSGWSLVSKLMQPKRVSCELVKVDANEMEKFDAELLAMRSSKVISAAQVQNVIKGLDALESSLQELEEELECVYRRMVKSRVSILNLLNH